MDTKANSCWNHGFVHHIIGIMMLGKEKPKHPTDPVVFYTQKKSVRGTMVLPRGDRC